MNLEELKLKKIERQLTNNMPHKGNYEIFKKQWLLLLINIILIVIGSISIYLEELKLEKIERQLANNTLEMQAAKGGDLSLNDRLGNITGGSGGSSIYVNAKDYGDNIADALATGKDVYVPDGKYPITQTLTVNTGQKLILAQDARILINANVDGVKVKHNGWLTGGKIIVNVDNWNMSAVVLDGSEPIDVFTTGISNITLMNGEHMGQYALSGNGLLLKATGVNDYVMFAHFLNMNILFFDKSIHLSAPVNGFINANNFQNIITKGKYGLYIDGGVSNQWQVQGNLFNNVQVQLTSDSISAVYCNGQANRIRLFSWDTHIVPDKSKIIHFPTGSFKNVIENYYGYESAKITNNGQHNLVIGY